MNFSLVPFPGEDPVPRLRVEGSISRQGSVLSLEFLLRGDLSLVAIPSPAPLPQRKDRLWEDTCLEFFLARPGSPSYHECNLSPAGHWNLYRFDSYRERMREEERVSSLPFVVQRDSGSLRLSLESDIGRILPPAGETEAAVCAVLRSPAGGASHWALLHPGPRPDFHHRGGFLKIPQGGTG